MVIGLFPVQIENGMGVGEEIFVQNLTRAVTSFTVHRFQNELDFRHLENFVFLFENSLSHVFVGGVEEKNFLSVHPMLKGPPGQMVTRSKALLNKGIIGSFDPVVAIHQRLQNVEGQRRVLNVISALLVQRAVVVGSKSRKGR